MEPVEPAQEFDPGPRPDHPNILQNEDPNFIQSGLNQVTVFLQSYGWFIVLGVIVLVYLKKKFEPTIEKLQRQRELQREYDNYDEDKVRQRHEAMEAHRRRLQEEHDAQAALYAEQQKKKEEEKRKAKIEDWERHKKGLGYRSKIQKPEDQPGSSSGPKPKPNKKPLRDPDFNPLMGGGGGGASFRPPRRSGAGGG